MFLDGVLLTEHYSVKLHESAGDKRFLVTFKKLGTKSCAQYEIMLFMLDVMFHTDSWDQAAIITGLKIQLRLRSF